MRDEQIFPWVGFEFHALKWHLGRRLFWTKGGTFGLGPDRMRPGDVVAILMSSDL